MIEWAVTSSTLILVVLLVRQCLKGHISLRLQYGLWALVLLRLLVPVNFGSGAWSVLNVLSELTPPQETAAPSLAEEADEINPQLSIVDPDPNVRPELFLVEPDDSLQPNMPAVEPVADPASGQEDEVAPQTVLTVVWAVGAVGVGAWLVGVNVRFARTLRRSRRPLEVENLPLPVYVTKAVQTPCLFGLVHPCIYMTEEAAADETVLRHSLAHEYTHFRHGDPVWAALRGLSLALHWYNPLVWLAAALSRRDGELCCDEATVRRLGEGERASYGRTLLAVTCQGRPHPLLTATSMTGRGQEIKERILLLTLRPRTTVWTLTAVVFLAVAAMGCTFTGASPQPQNQSIASADLDRDGQEEQIQVESVGEDFWQLVVVKKDGTELLREDAALAHAGWNSLYLYTDDQGQASLLRYNPYMSTGQASFSYTLFTLEGGEETVLQEGSLSFEVSQVPDQAEEIQAFAREVNTLLLRSSLLLSTQDGTRIVGPEPVGAHLESLEEFSSRLGEAELPQKDMQNDTD